MSEDIVPVLFEHALGPLGSGDDLHCKAANEILELRKRVIPSREVIEAICYLEASQNMTEEAARNQASRIAGALISLTSG